jgi:hypothetical protein
MEQGAQRLAQLRLAGLGDQPHTVLSAALREKAERGEEPVLIDPEALSKAYRPAAGLTEIIDRILDHVRRKAPAGNKYVPLIGHRDYGIAGAPDREAFDHALGVAVEEGYLERQALSEAAFRLTLQGWNYLRTLEIKGQPISRVFLSHAAKDKDLAEAIRSALHEARNDLVLFVASRPGDIRADEDWLPVVQREIRAADAYCVLLTPNSTGRPWVWFETGAAWMSEKKWVIARANLPADAVPLPLSTRQTYSIDDGAGAREVFRALDVELADAGRFADTIRTILARQVEIDA